METIHKSEYLSTKWLMPLFMVASAILVWAQVPPVAQKAGSPPPTSRPAGRPGEGTSGLGNFSVTHHSVTIDGRKIDYTATAGYLTLRDEADRPRADLFFVAYEKNDAEDRAQWPVTFAFNGGPGAAAIWLHFGGLGPRRLPFPDNGTTLATRPRLIDNDYSWLDFTDLVFIDPVGTGYSRPAPGVDPKQFFTAEGDVKSIAQFIRAYITKYDRWLSPKFITGESYGTTRAAGLATTLQNDLGIYLDGIVLISAVLNFQTISFDRGNDLPFVLSLPTYTAAAWYHRKLGRDLQKDLPATLIQAEQWAQTRYVAALTMGDRLPTAERARVVADLSRFTGLSRDVIEVNNLRISNWRFVKELLRRERRLIGLMDGRYVGIDLSAAGEHGQYDPSFFMTIGPLNAVMNDYVRGELNYKNNLPYEYLSRKANQAWEFMPGDQGYLNVAPDLKDAMTRNTALKVFVAGGYYDLTTPYFSNTYVVDHLGLDPSLRPNIKIATYPSGHQMYTNLPTLRQLRQDVRAFFVPPP